MEEFIDLFKKSLSTGFIDKAIGSEFLYQPKLLVNSKDPRKKVLTSLLHELNTCESFFISVAFVTTGGVATIINALQDLQERKIPGKVVVSQYLNFTQPEALRRLLQFDNIELRIATKVDAHSKGYLFKKKDYCNLIVGSSNLTQTALSSNKEWNLQVSAIAESKIIDKVYQEFEKDFNAATVVTDAFINEYQITYDRKRLLQSDFVEKEAEQKLFEPNEMQKEALANLNELRVSNKNKALIISATGTGKTYLSAFDAKAFGAKKVLFVVHRLNIAKKAMSTFQQVFGKKKSMGLYSGNRRESEKDFLFSTVQTISREDHLKSFSKDHFDYIIIDESHRSGAKSYINLINYFSPKFLLGMTATPERTDGSDIFQLFDHNIAYEIRLNRAMEEQMLCPFHYYGVSDLFIDDEEQDDLTTFNRLTSDERVEKIISKSVFYGTDNGVCRGLVFVSNVKEAFELSKKFNEKGFKTIALSGSNSTEERSKAIQSLESDNEPERIDYIFTVDIFNEGIDIPKVNQIIMLRPTESAIIFVQQLGRGLRKLEAKSYLTVIDFIGNHNNNYLIPVALYGDSSFDKDTLRKLLSAGSTDLPGVSTINFDRVSKEKIFESIDAANLRLLRDLKKDYFLLKYRLGRIPMMMDFLESNARNPFLFVEYSKSYLNFVLKVDPEIDLKLSKDLSDLLELFSIEINNGKRVEESTILRQLLEKEELSITQLQTLIHGKYEYQVEMETIESACSNLNFEFVRKPKNIIVKQGGIVKLHPDFKVALEDKAFREFLTDSVNYSLRSFDESFNLELFQKGFVLYQKYGRKDVCRLLNWEKDISSTVYGYRTNKNSTPCFVTYHKSEQIEDSINYNDHFISPSVFAWESRSNRKIESSEIQKVIKSERILLFVKKGDSEGKEFYYLGDAAVIPESVIQSKMPDSKQPVVHFKFQLDQPVSENLYSYITDLNEDKGQPEVLDIPLNNAKIVESERPVFKLPLYDLYAAAGSFSEMQTSKAFNLIEVPERFQKDGYFAFKVMGESMNRRIPNGSICIFKQPVVGSRSGKILLIENYDKQDPDLKSHFTVKTYTSSKIETEEGLRNTSIILKPNSYDKTYQDIVITDDDTAEKQFNVVGEFVDVLETEQNLG